jgi:hypothetical protein
VSDQYAGRWADALFDQNSKLIKNTSFTVWTDSALTASATTYTDRTKSTTVGSSTLMTDNTGEAEIYATPGTYWIYVESALLARKIDVREDIADTLDTNTGLLKTNNLSDLNNVATSRTNLGLGSAATQPASGFDNAGAAASAYAMAQAYANAVAAGSGGAGALFAINNLSDLNNVASARTNLGLGSAATQPASGFDAAGAAAAALATAQAYTNSVAFASGGGGSSWNLRNNVTAPATAAAWDYIVADTTSASGGFAITAPTPTLNKKWGVKWKAGTTPPTLTGSFESTPPTFPMLKSAYEFIGDGTSWLATSAYYPAASLARLDKDNDFGAHVLKNYRDDQANYTAATALLGIDIPWGSSRQLTNSIGCVLTLPNDTTLGVGSWALVTQGSAHQDSIVAASGASVVEPDALYSTAKAYASLLIRCVANNGTSVSYQVSGYTGAAPLLLDTSGVPTAFAAYGLRQLAAAYAGSAIQVTRASDSTPQDIGFTAGGTLDVGTLATFCAGTTGYISKWYDQSGNGHDLVQATQANMWRIYASGAIDVAGTKSIPSLFSPDAARGMSCTAFTAYTGTIVSGAAVAKMTNSVTTAAPRFLTVWGASNTDNSDNVGAELFARNGSATPTQAWLTRHNASSLAASGGAVYSQLQQLMTQIDNGATTMDTWVDGVNSHLTASVGAFSFTKIGVGNTGNAIQSVTGASISEAIVFLVDIDATAQAAIRSNQKAYFGTS